MIKALRIDERFVHGEIATRWCPFLEIERIIVANDELLNNKVQMMALKMAQPKDVIMKICSINEAINILNDPRLRPFNTLVIVNNPKDALTLSEKVREIPMVIQGNYGMINPDGKKIHANCLMLDYNDINYLQEITKIKTESFYQILPDGKKIYLKDLI